MKYAQWNRNIWSAALLLALACGEKEADAPADEGSAEQDASAAQWTDGIGGTITGVSGPGGVKADALAEGTFLGQGGKLSPGQAAWTPKGTLAELELASGGRVRLNEDTKIVMPGADHPGAVLLERGELVLLAGKAGDANHLVVQAAGETFTVGSGEAQVRATADGRRWAVIHGHAKLEAGARSIELGAGESIETPLPEQKEEAPIEPKPELSLRPLDDTTWARTFDAAAQMADTVPRGVGSLTARRPGSSSEQQRLRLTDHQVHVNISGRLAHTEVEQEFFNDRGAVLEGIYRFPLPDDGSISGLELLVGNRWMVGEVVEKERARAIFASIVDATIPRDPALLEWERGNIFKLRIFPIPGNGERRVKLSYTQVLPVVGGKMRYRYPMGGTGATGTPIDHFQFTVTLDGAQLEPGQAENITTPMLALERRDASDGNVQLTTERDHFLPTFDLGVDVPVAELQERVHASTHLDKDGQAYFMVALQPDFELPPVEGPVNWAFVLDRSHSTTPELWTAARGVVDALTELMDEGDRFTVLACDSACEEHPAGLQRPDSPSVDSVQRFLDEQDLAGASDLGAALLEAREALDRGAAGAQRVVVYLGDGVPTSGELAADDLADLVEAPLQDTRVLAVALGARSDLTTLGAVVERTGGDLVRADARDDLRSLVRELRLRAEVPAARNATFEVPEGMVLVREQNASALRPGDTVVLAGKLRHPVSGEIKLRAQGPAGPVETSFPVELSPTRSTSTSPVSAHLPRTWANMQIQHLTQTKGFDAKDEIIALSKDYTVLSRHTALLVLENDAMYREFNVVRKAKDTDRWKGDLPEVTSEAKPADDPVEPEPADAETSKAEVGARDKDQREAGAPEKIAGGVIDPRGGGEGDASKAKTPAPTTTPPSAQPPPPPASRPHRALEPEADFEPGRSADGEDRRQFGPPAEQTPVDEALPEAEEEDEAGADPGAAATGRAGERKNKDDKADPFRDLPAKPQAKKKSKSSSSRLDPLDGGGGASGSTWERRPPSWRGVRRVPVRVLQARTFPTPSSSAAARIAALRAAVQADPTKRSAHSALVRTALRNGHAELLQFAQAWAEVDPDHHRALTSLADALAVTGDPLALRAYESAVEVLPFSSSEHEHLAAAFENKGDLRRACSHRRAVVSIDPAKTEHHAELVACLQRAGRVREASSAASAFVVTAGSPKVEAARRRDLDKKVAAATLAVHGSAELRAKLTWSGADDLDVAIVDGRGRRLSTLRPDGVKVVEGRGSEELTLRKVRGSLFVEVTRVGGDLEEGRPAPVSAVLELRTSGRRKTVPLVLEPGTQRVAKVFWTTVFR
jgi:hypothetical protein